MPEPPATIIGGQGFIGHHLAARLSAEGWECHVPGRLQDYDRRRDNGHLYYCAGLTADYASRPFETIEAHVGLLARILEAGNFDSLVYLSSTRLYDSQPGIVATEEIPLAFSPGNPRHLYDLSKALGESLCLTTSNKRARIARLSCVYNDHTDRDGFLPCLLRQVITSRASALEIDSSAAFARDYVHLQDVLSALILIAREGTEPIYNVAAGENTSNAQLFDTISRLSGSRIIPLRHDTPPAPARISIERMQSGFSWRPVSVLEKITSILEENM